MANKLSIPSDRDIKPRIVVIGVGGAGGNAVNNMITAGLEGVEFIVANTDAQALENSKAEKRIQIGSKITQGLGAGADAEIGRESAKEALPEIMDTLHNAHMVFITAGMGGGTGTGAAPVIARATREHGILTVGVVAKPFTFEGSQRMRTAEAGIDTLAQDVDTLIVIPNQNLFTLVNQSTPMSEAFALVDEVLHSGVASITDLMIKPGIINLDFADVRTVMRSMGKAMIGTGEAEGDSRGQEAAEIAIANPLLDTHSMRGAQGVLINITGGADMTLFEVEEAANIIKNEVDNDANIIVGSALDETLDGVLRVSVVATGIGTMEEEAQEDDDNKIVNLSPLTPPAGTGDAMPLAPLPHEPAPMPIPEMQESSFVPMAPTPPPATQELPMEDTLDNKLDNKGADLSSEEDDDDGLPAFLTEETPAEPAVVQKRTRSFLDKVLGKNLDDEQPEEEEIGGGDDDEETPLAAEADTEIETEEESHVSVAFTAPVAIPTDDVVTPQVSVSSAPSSVPLPPAASLDTKMEAEPVPEPEVAPIPEAIEETAPSISAESEMPPAMATTSSGPTMSLGGTMPEPAPALEQEPAMEAQPEVEPTPAVEAASTPAPTMEAPTMESPVPTAMEPTPTIEAPTIDTPTPMVESASIQESAPMPETSSNNVQETSQLDIPSFLRR